MNKQQIELALEQFKKVLNDNTYLNICNSAEMIIAIKCMEQALESEDI